MRVLQIEGQGELFMAHTLWPLKGRRTGSAGAVGSVLYGFAVGATERSGKLATEQDGDVAC